MIVSKAVFVSAPIYVICGSSAKLALLIFYLRLSPQQWFIRAVWATICIIAIYSPILFFTQIFVCKPVAKAYAVIHPYDGKCFSQASLYIALAVANIITDILLATVCRDHRSPLRSYSLAPAIITVFVFGSRYIEYDPSYFRGDA